MTQCSEFGYPVLYNLYQLQNKVSHKDEIRFRDIGDGNICACYMIATSDTFDDEWSRECRGIVFDATTGEVKSRPLPKFFNLNEREETQLHNLDWSQVVNVYDKRDGSFIHPVLVNGWVRMKSKKTFDSDVAKAAQAYVDARPDLQEMCRYLLQDQNGTPIFEYTAPDARIVLHYPEPKLTLLHIRGMTLGCFWHRENVTSVAEKFNVPVVDLVYPPVPQEEIGKWLLEQAQIVQGIEGWIVEFSDGRMVKVKTAWYMERHRAATMLRVRDVAEMVINETIDDVKSMLVGDGRDISEIEEIERRVLNDFRHIQKRAEETFALIKDKDRKDAAIFLQSLKTPYMGLAMSLYSGKEADVKTFFAKNVFKQEYDLRQLAFGESIAESD